MMPHRRTGVKWGTGTETPGHFHPSGGKLPSVAEEDKEPSEQRSWFIVEDSCTA